MFPFGVLFTVIVSIRGCKEKMKFIGTVFVGIFISVVVECFQYLFHRGLTDIDDIMHNGIGVTLGYLTNFMIRKLDIEVNRLRRKGKGL